MSCCGVSEASPPRERQVRSTQCAVEVRPRWARAACEDGPGAVEEALAFGAEEVAARGDDGGEGVACGVGVAVAGEGEEVGEGEAAPRGVQDGEPGCAVGGVEEGAGEGEGVEDFGALVEVFDVEGAEGDGAVRRALNSATSGVRCVRARARTAMRQGLVRPSGSGTCDASVR